MSRSRNLDLWRRVAAGDLSRAPDPHHPDTIDLHAWVESVARRILEADQGGDAKARPYALAAALGLQGKADPYADLRALIEEPQWQLARGGSDGAWGEVGQAETVTLLVAEARERGLLRGEYSTDPKAAADLVRKLFQKKL